MIRIRIRMGRMGRMGRVGVGIRKWKNRKIVLIRIIRLLRRVVISYWMIFQISHYH